MKKNKSIENSLPIDLAFKIVSSLQVSDLCSLGSCSRFWRDLCGSDSLWQALCKDRWPSIVLDNQDSQANSKGWRAVYLAKHAEMVKKADSIIDFVDRGSSSFESMEVGRYLKAIEDMRSMQFEFQDVKLFFLKPKMNALVNLIGLHYCVMLLNIPAKNISEELSNHNIESRQVCVQWWELGRWHYGYRLQDDMQYREVSLTDVTAAKGKQVLDVLHRGAVHEVFRVRITVSKPISRPWSYQYIPQYK